MTFLIDIKDDILMTGDPPENGQLNIELNYVYLTFKLGDFVAGLLFGFNLQCNNS